MAPEIPRPTAGDVVELILDDHRVIEELLRGLRDETEDRTALRTAFAHLLVAHGEAEESKVYGPLQRTDAIGQVEVEHSTEEHDEGYEALLTLLEVEDVDSEDFSAAIHQVSERLSHHMDEEERDILNPARTDVSAEKRAMLGASWAAERNRLLDADCGAVANVRRLVERATRPD
jgi:hemerythrin-like domain-containing protein